MVLVQKMYISEVATLLSCLIPIPSTHLFSCNTCLKESSFWWSIFPLLKCLWSANVSGWSHAARSSHPYICMASQRSGLVWLPETSYLTLLKSNGLSKHLKDQQVIHLDLNTSPKLAVKWIILKWYYVVDFILNSTQIIVVFYCKFCALKIILFYITYF